MLRYCSAFGEGDGSLWRRSSSAALYASWSAYATAAGENPGSKKAFALALEEKGLAKPHKKTKEGRGFYGLRLPEQDAGEADDYPQF